MALKLEAPIAQATAKKEHFTAKEEPFLLQKLIPSISVFTTRPDTLFGATYLVLAPEHQIIEKLKRKIKNWPEVLKYIKASKAKKEMERMAEGREKTGVALSGVRAINPATKESITVFIADYVLAGYGTGAIMAVPAHDQRDFEFAKEFKLPIREAIEPLFNADDKGEDAIRKGLPFKERHAAVCIVKHWSEDKYIGLKWKKTDWRGFVVGGIEDGESLEDAGRREIAEETGYKNAKFVKKLGGIIHSQFYHPLKNENRWAKFQGLYFELENGEREEISAEENAIHEVLWLTRDEVEKFLNARDMRHFWQRLLRGDVVYTDKGIVANSGKFTGIPSEKAKLEIVKAVGGVEKVSYKLRDWVFSRQRYWGEPIPIIHCENCGTVAVPLKDLPVKLPDVKNFKPTESGESPLANVSTWINVKCPECGGKAKRETDVMPNWAGSSWYYLRYVDPQNKKKLADRKKLNHWMPVDWYNGGMEHTTLHLLYSRFWHKFLFDIGAVPGSEPYAKRTAHGLILAEGGEKMSKSKGNVVNPDDIIKMYGADTLRVYEMFMGPFDQAISWSSDSIIGARRFIEKVWKLSGKVAKKTPADRELESLVTTAVKKVGDDIEEMKFNTAVSHMMILVNEMDKRESIDVENYKTLLQLVAPFAPHAVEELWRIMKGKKSVHEAKWPRYDPKKVAKIAHRIIIQINGKLRDSIMVEADEAEQAEVVKKALARDTVRQWTEGKEVKRVIYVPKRLLNIVV
ncbi:MAG: class I tRNA ligase family protein [bacterium]|nr:class I tRNA ligase family protein [bacterium]